MRFLLIGLCTLNRYAAVRMLPEYQQREFIKAEKNHRYQGKRTDECEVLVTRDRGRKGKVATTLVNKV